MKVSYIGLVTQKEYTAKIVFLVWIFHIKMCYYYYFTIQDFVQPIQISSHKTQSVPGVDFIIDNFRK